MWKNNASKAPHCQNHNTLTAVHSNFIIHADMHELPFSLQFGVELIAQSAVPLVFLFHIQHHGFPLGHRAICLPAPE